ncbi:MAG TPA: hypothetical protein VGE13_02250 [Candidatus Saccharimonadales bacterium]
MKNSGSRFFPMFITLVIIVLIIVAIVAIGRAIFSGGTDAPTAMETDQGRTELLKTSDDHSVSLTVRGPIIADEDFKSYRIAVAPDSRSMNVYKGYLDENERSKKLDNNAEAYEQFVYALDKANMMKGTEPSDEGFNDLRGVCATGYVYEYAVLVDNEPVKHLWTSTCSGSKGTLQASVDQLNSLFMNQIPNSNELIPFKLSGPRLKF